MTKIEYYEKYKHQCKILGMPIEYKTFTEFDDGMFLRGIKNINGILKKENLPHKIHRTHE